MIKMPYEDIIKKITENSSLSESEIESRIKDKMDQLSGLVSKDGAANIIANELGVKLFENLTGKITIEKILPGMRSVETVGKVIAKYDVKEFHTNNRDGKVGSMIIGDETGSVRVVCWGDQTDKMNQVKQGDIIIVKEGYIRENNGTKEIHLNDRSLMTINPPGETIGEVKTDTMKSGSYQRKQISDITESQSNIELLGTIVQTFEPKFFEVCPQCGGRARPQNGEFICGQHGSVNPDYSYLVTLYLDDGTENIRTVFFREQVEKLLGKSKSEVLEYKDTPEKFEDVKTELLGNIIKVMGRSKKNEMFDRIEFTADDVDIKPDPEEEIKILKQNQPKEE